MTQQDHPDGPLPRDFPLSVAKNGQFRKRLRGREYRFGAVSAGWRAALARYSHDWPYILVGKVPPPLGELTMSVSSIAARFIAREAERVKRGELHPRTFIDNRRSIEIAVQAIGPKTPPELLSPDEWATLRHELGYVWRIDDDGKRFNRTDERLGVCAWRRRINAVRQMIRWAGPRPEGQGFSGAPNYGGRFKSIADSTIMRNSHARARERGKKNVYTPDDVRKILNDLKGELQLYAMFLLSINAAFTSADCSALPWSALDLDGGWLDFPRVKNSNDRPRTPLWPETVKALRAVKALGLRCNPAHENRVIFQQVGENGEPFGMTVRLKDCVFVHDDGQEWVITNSTGEKDAAGFATTYSNRDRIGQDRFRDMLIRLDIHRRGMGFATGRHTFKTYAARYGDDNLSAIVTGHAFGNIGQFYDHGLDDDLRAMSESVRERLLHAKDGEVPGRRTRATAGKRGR